MNRKITALFLCLALVLPLSLTGCGVRAKASNLMEGVLAQGPGEDVEMTEEAAASVADFAVRLLQRDMGEGSVLLSPLSVLCALAMTANGAEGGTLAQLEEVFGLSVPELNQFLSSYRSALSSPGENKLHFANSIWLKEGLAVEREFLQTNADYYGAEVYQAPFDDATLSDINHWVSSHTDGVIPKILSELSPDAVLYLINALAFEARWQEPYQKGQVRDGVFTREDGTGQAAEMMYSSEGQYLSDGIAQGFLKYYTGGDYAFAALLPEEGVSVEEYVDSLTGEKVARLLNGAQALPVEAAIPKFTAAHSTELSEPLRAMGITDAFDRAAADFSGIGSYGNQRLVISQVLHKTYLEVDETGTKAGAATAVELAPTTSSPIESEEIRRVYLNRPFIYLVIDCQPKRPLVLGTVMELEE